MSARRWRVAAFLVPSLLLATLGAVGSATAATTSASTVNTSNFACSNGVCEIGPGNVGMPFAAAVPGTGGPAYYGPECDPYIMSVVSGSLPPGLRFVNLDCSYAIMGTPTKAGTYSFAVQVTPQPNSIGQSTGPSGTQQLTITIGTGNSDRMANVAAGYNGHLLELVVFGFDANVSASFSVSLTSTGAVIIPPEAPGNLSNFSDSGRWQLTLKAKDPCGNGNGFVSSNSCNLTVTDSLGSSVTIILPPAKY